MELAIFALIILGCVISVMFVRRRRKNDKTTDYKLHGSSGKGAVKRFDRDDHNGPPTTAEALNADQEAEEEIEPENQAEDEDMKIEDYVADAEEHFAEGSYDAAIECYGAAIELAQSKPGCESMEMARLLIKQGQAFQVRDYQSDGEELYCTEYLRAFAIIEQRLGTNSEELLPVLNLLVAWYFQTGDQQKAEALIRRSQNIIDMARETKRLAVENSETAASALAESEAEVKADAVAKTEKPSPFAVPFNSADKAANKLCQEADKAFAKGDHEEAATALESAIESLQDKIGRSVPELALLFHRLGRVRQAMNGLDPTDEIEYGFFCEYQTALSMLVQAHGYDAAELAPVLLDLASLEDQRGEHYRAEGYLRRLEAIERIKR